MKSVLPHCWNKQRLDVHRAGQSAGGESCTTCAWYDYNCCLRNSPADRSRNSVPLRYRPCAHSGILFDHAQNLLLYVLDPRSSRFLPVRSRRKRSLFVTTTVDWLKNFLSGYSRSGISGWYKLLPAALLSTANSQMHGVSLNPAFETIAISTAHNPHYTLQQCCTLSHCCDCIKSE
jgi:hypothetical protein